MIECILCDVDALVMLVIVNEVCKAITMRTCQTHKNYKTALARLSKSEHENEKVDKSGGDGCCCYCLMFMFACVTVNMILNFG